VFSTTSADPGATVQINSKISTRGARRFTAGEYTLLDYNLSDYKVMTRPSRRRTLHGWLLGGLIAAVFVLPLCDLHFDCGCTWPWLGAESQCDIHVPGPPDCPWCAHLWIAVLDLGLAYAVGGIAAYFASARLSLWWSAAVVSFTILSVGLISGAITSLVLGLAPLAGW
jgi:hypothetical protein